MNKFEHTKRLFQSNNILNIYKLNILNVTTFLCKVNQKTAPYVFRLRFRKTYHCYPTRFSKLDYIQTIRNIKMSKYLISIRGPYIWNNFLTPEEKQITTLGTSVT